MAATVFFALTGPGLYPTLSAAAKVVNLAISDHQGVYRLALEAILDAPSDDVRHVITDYVHIYRIDPSIVESKIVGRSGTSVTRVKTLINECVLFFCKPILRVEDVRETGNNDIYSVVIPRLSNVRSGTEHWQIHPLGDRTRLDFTSTLEPGFFLPPLIGSLILERKLQEEALICLNNIERIARIRNQESMAHNPTQTETFTKHIIPGYNNAN